MDDVLTSLKVRNIRVRSGVPLARSSGRRVFISVLPRVRTSSNITCLDFCLRRSRSGRGILTGIGGRLRRVSTCMGIKTYRVRRSRARSMS